MQTVIKPLQQVQTSAAKLIFKSRREEQAKPLELRDMVHGCMVYTERAETATVSRGTSHVKTKQRSKYTSSVAIVKTRYEKRHALTHLESQATNAQRVCSRAENSVTQKIERHHLFPSNCIGSP